MTQSTTAPGTMIRQFSRCGPCTRAGELVRETAQFFVVREGGRERRVRKETEARYSPFHAEGCPSCPGSANYPDGYQD